MKGSLDAFLNLPAGRKSAALRPELKTEMQ
jgi:hypothetical protein